MRSYYRLFLYLIVLCTVIFFFSIRSENLYYDDGIEIAPNPDSVYQDIDLYFINDEGLVKEERHIRRSTGSRETDIFNELKKGSINKGFKSPIGKNTSILSIEITMGTCYVNFPDSFLESKQWLGIPNDYVIWSIVNSLTSLEDINSVQFLFNGDKIKDDYDLRLDKPFEFNKKILAESTLLYFNTAKEFVLSISARRFVKAYGYMSTYYKKENTLEEFMSKARKISDSILMYDYVSYKAKRFDNDVTITLMFKGKNRELNDNIYYEWKLVEEESGLRIEF